MREDLNQRFEFPGLLCFCLTAAIFAYFFMFTPVNLKNQQSTALFYLSEGDFGGVFCGLVIGIVVSLPLGVFAGTVLGILRQLLRRHER